MVWPDSCRRSGLIRYRRAVVRLYARYPCLLLLQAQLVAPGALARGVVRGPATLPHLLSRAADRGEVANFGVLWTVRVL